MSTRRTVLVLVAGLLLPATALRADPDSGPAAGSKLAPLKALAAYGDDAGKEVDFAAKRRGKSTVFVFVQADKWDRPMYRFLRTLDELLKKDRTDVSVVAVWLSDDADKAKAYLARAEPTLKMLSQTTFGIHGSKNGPKVWNVNPDAHLTAVVVEGDKVSVSVGLTSVNETDAKDVVKKLNPKK
jgi:hypothetical protein